MAGITIGCLALAGALIFWHRRQRQSGQSHTQAMKAQAYLARGGGAMQTPFLPLPGTDNAGGAPLNPTSPATFGQSAPQVTSMDTRNIAKYFVGMRVTDFGPMRVTGTISAIMPNIPASTTGPGRFEVTHDPPAGASAPPGAAAAPQDQTTTMDTRNVSKYFVGLRVEEFGPTRVTGIVSQVIPSIPGSQGGAGKIVVTHDPEAPPPRSFDGDAGEMGTNATVVSIEDINKYHLGQRLFGPSKIQGRVTSITPDGRNGISGEITITHETEEAPSQRQMPDAAEQHTVLDSSNVSKYWVGMRLDNFGPTQVNGTVTSILPTDPKNAGGPGRIIVKHDDVTESGASASGGGGRKKKKSMFSRFGRKKK